MKSKWLRLLLITTCVLLVVWLGILCVRAERGLATATDLTYRGLWSQARPPLERYLWLHPSNERARLLMAEVLVRDNLLESEQAVREALDHLSRIPDDSPNASAARTKEGRLRFFILHQPHRAERVLREVLAREPANGEAAYVLWKVLDLTGRFDSAEPAFLVVFRQAPPEQRAERLRAWYMSQFFPLTANIELERMMGLLGPDESPTTTTELRRYRRFQQTEPDQALGYICEAYWLQREGDPRGALELLDKTGKRVDDAWTSPFFLSTLVNVLIDLGEYERAEAAFGRWPPPHEGYDYWKWQAIVQDEIRGDGPAALDSYDKALGVWPGPVEWRLRNRKAGCLRRLGRQQDAQREVARAKEIEALMEDDVQRRNRLVLGQLDAPAQLWQLRDFYDQLGREFETQAWSGVVQWLRESAVAQPK